jgi:hypothetical protein
MNYPGINCQRNTYVLVYWYEKMGFGVGSSTPLAVTTPQPNIGDLCCFKLGRRDKI